ncbi:MAG: hypothetical protein V4490_01295 [Pseudomonadota bacterium]
MFGIDSHQTLPNAISMSYAAWDDYMAHIWYNLLYFFDLKLDGVIIEVAPGGSTKIAQALEKMVFRGDVHLIEPQAALGRDIYHRYQQILPKATIHLHQNTLQEVIGQLPKRVDALVSNHALDDMLLAETHYTTPDLFHWAARGDEQSIVPYQQIWGQLKNNPQELQRCINNIINLWTSTIHDVQPKNVLLSQYSSFHMALHQLDDLNHEAWKMLQSLQQIYAHHCLPPPIIQTILNSMKHYNNPHIGFNILNAKHWLGAVI